MPGAAAYAVAADNKSNAIGAHTSFKILVFMVVSLIAALLVDVNFGHEPTEVLRVV
jgi:hypothetical protein